MLVLIAAVAGVAVALQGQFMGETERRVGTVTTLLITYGLGGAISALLWVLRRAPAPGGNVPWYGWTAGGLGLIIVGGIGYAAPRLGLSRTLVITVAAQLIAALLIEQFGLFGSTPRPAELTKIAGVLLTITGVWLVVR